MPVDDSLSDDLVASLLAKDAKASTAKYSAYGLQELLPKRPTYTAPKPNTRFLKNIIKETDTHNAALRAKEASESRARLRKLHDMEVIGPSAEESYGRLSREDDPPPKRRRIDRGDETRPSSSRTDKREHLRRDEVVKSRSHRSHRRRRDRSYESDEDRYERSHHHRRYEHRKSHRRRSQGKSRSRNRSKSRDEMGGSKDSQSRSRSPQRSRSRSLQARKRHHRHRSRRKSRSGSLVGQKNSERLHAVPVPNGDREEPKSTDKDSSIGRNRGSPLGSDSDPLEAIIGPPPPPSPPKVRARGRGTFASTSAMDSHFSSTYDPSIDVQPDADVDDDWDMALEALRDRQKWQKQGAERLKAAGFTEEEVQKWEKGGQKRDEDVRWRGRGEGREWDRGKVIGDDGVETGAEWGRLKGT